MIIVFDVNETLLDLSPLTPQFAAVFGDPSVTGRWFAQLLQLSLVATVTERYHDFATLAKEALRMQAKRHNLSLSGREETRILDTLTQLPAHPDVPESLERLRAAGFRLVTLTNSPPATLQQQLSHAGILDYFEQTLSVDTVRLFKPHPKVYQTAATHLGVLPEQLRLVAAHNWDTSGAIRAGCRAAFIARAQMVLGELDERPDIIADSLTAVTEQIILHDSP